MCLYLHGLVIASPIYKLIIMKSSILYHCIVSFTRVALVLLFCVSLASCARKIRFDTSSIVPAAQGTVKLKTDKNNNHSINIDVRHLADPTRLTPAKSVYVAWIETDGKGPQNIGQLRTSSGLISNTLKASLEAVSPFKPTRLFITAEDQANIEYPSSYVVLNTTSF
jgi:hypothetical protein